MDKEYIPIGLTEEQFVKICYDVSRDISPRYKFGYFSDEDIIAHGVMIAIDIVKKGKFKPRGEKPMDKQLRNFLYVWLRNRLSNLRRDKSCRYPNKGGYNQVKYNVMHFLNIYSQGLSNSEIFARDNTIIDDLDRRELISKIVNRLSPDEKIIYEKYIENKLNKKDTKLLFDIVKRIINEI